jgi:hypothetical protein
MEAKVGFYEILVRIDFAPKGIYFATLVYYGRKRGTDGG